MHSFYNLVLKLDLNQQCFDIETIPDTVLTGRLGGKGLAIWLLMKYNPPGVDPLGPENNLILATGPVAGTAVWGSSRYGAFSKSPQTNCYAESYSGGRSGEYISRTGFDAFVLANAAEEPTWIEISEEGAIFHVAEDLWGLDTYTTEDRVKNWIRQNRPKARNCTIICIGPAGENQVSFAVIENDYWRSAGRTGLGAVMGSKKIKAIAFWGNKAKKVADPDLIKQFTRNIAEVGKSNEGVKAYKTMGTPMLVDITNRAGCFPTRYWHKGTCSHVDQINAAALHKRMDVIPHACLRCFMSCGRLGTVKNGRHRGMKIEGPEYETIYAFGGLCEVNSIEEIAYLNDLCDRFGLDTITAGNLAGLTIEAARQGRIKYDIDYGQVDGIARLLGDISTRKGIGNVLAQGIQAVAKEWNMEEQAIHVKGLEPAGYDPRVLKGMGLAYATSDRGACHLRTTFYKAELSGMVDPDEVEGKSAVLTEWEDRLTIFDTLILCRFYRDLYQWEELATIIEATTGMALGKKEMREIASKVKNDIRLFNLREGVGAEGDILPKRFYDEPLPENGASISRNEMKKLLGEYYTSRDWDPSGHPSK